MELPLKTDDQSRVKGRLHHLSDHLDEDMVLGEERLRQLADLLPTGLAPGQAIKILSTYFQALDKTFNDYRKAANLWRRQMESDSRALSKLGEEQKQEIERLTSDLLDLTNTLEEHESLLSTANQKVASYEKQFKRLTRENSEMTNKLTQKENDALFFRQELDRSVQENEAGAALLATANNRINDLERRMAVERENTQNQEKEVRRLTLALSESQNKNAITERKMEEMVVKYNDEMRRISERSIADGQHAIALMRKQVRSSVAPEMREFRQLVSAKPSLEMVSTLKALLLRLLAKLEQAGLDLK